MRLEKSLTVDFCRTRMNLNCTYKGVHAHAPASPRVRTDGNSRINPKKNRNATNTPSRAQKKKQKNRELKVDVAKRLKLGRSSYTFREINGTHWCHKSNGVKYIIVYWAIITMWFFNILSSYVAVVSSRNGMNLHKWCICSLWQCQSKVGEEENRKQCCYFSLLSSWQYANCRQLLTVHRRSNLQNIYYNNTENIPQKYDLLINGSWIFCFK